MALRVKSFRIHNESEEQDMNRFLEGKVVRHWSATYSGDPSLGIWNVLIGFEPAREERGDRKKNERPERGDRGHDRGERPQRDNQRNGNVLSEQPKREKRERVEQVIDVPEGDMPLYEAVRKWRNARAREADVKPFQLFNNKQLESLVKAKPSTPEALRAILTDMEAATFDRYQHELLGFIQGATSAEPIASV